MLLTSNISDTSRRTVNRDSIIVGLSQSFTTVLTIKYHSATTGDHSAIRETTGNEAVFKG